MGESWYSRLLLGWGTRRDPSTKRAGACELYSLSIEVEELTG